MKISSKALRLYAVTDRSWLKENQTLADSVEKAILGGVTIVQLREKNTDFQEQLSLAQELKTVCKKYNVPLIINDSVELALKSGADGVHLGQSDGDIKKAREILGNITVRKSLKDLKLTVLPKVKFSFSVLMKILRE